MRLCWGWRNTWWWTLQVLLLKPCRSCFYQQFEHMMRCLLLLGRSFCSLLCSSRLAILLLRLFRRYHLHFHHKSRWFFCMKRQLPGKIAALIAGKESSILYLIVVGFQVRGDLTLCVVCVRRKSELAHLNFIDILAKGA